MAKTAWMVGLAVADHPVVADALGLARPVWLGAFGPRSATMSRQNGWLGLWSGGHSHCGRSPRFRFPPCLPPNCRRSCGVSGVVFATTITLCSTSEIPATHPSSIYAATQPTSSPISLTMSPSASICAISSSLSTYAITPTVTTTSFIASPMFLVPPPTKYAETNNN